MQLRLESEMREPLVTIGIPTFNRSQQLRRALQSAVDQTWPCLEIIVSDNASTDDTPQVCAEFSQHHPQVSIVRQPENVGPAGNFQYLLDAASGEYFIWLGDDDFFDARYVEACVQELMSNSDVVMVSGVGRYYRGDSFEFEESLLEMLHDRPAGRVLRYYRRVSYNTSFYSLTRTDARRSVWGENIVGGDWHQVAALSYMGKARMLTDVAVHRSLDGASRNLESARVTQRLPGWQSRFPRLVIAVGAFRSIVIVPNRYYQESLSATGRLMLGILVFLKLSNRFWGRRRIKETFKHWLSVRKQAAREGRNTDESGSI